MNTGRPESLRPLTLLCLNALGEEYRVAFPDELLEMRRGGWEAKVEEAKVDGIRRFLRASYRVMAFVDNEPAHLAAVAREFPDEEILLHADTIFRSRRERLQAGSASGTSYGLERVAADAGLPRHVELVWEWMGSWRGLREFLAIDVRWAELRLRQEDGGQLRVERGDSAPGDGPGGGPRLDLARAVRELAARGRAIKLRVPGGGDAAPRLVRTLRRRGVAEEDLWFELEPGESAPGSFKLLRQAFPRARLGCRVDRFAKVVQGSPADAKRTLETARTWGVRRLSLRWDTPAAAEVLARLDDWGFETDLYGIRDLRSFLAAVVLRPSSISGRLSSAASALSSAPDRGAAVSRKNVTRGPRPAGRGPGVPLPSPATPLGGEPDSP